MRNKIIESDLKYIANGNLPWENFIDKTILITGASGFIPSYLVDTFLYLNVCDVATKAPSTIAEFIILYESKLFNITTSNI